MLGKVFPSYTITFLDSMLHKIDHSSLDIKMRLLNISFRHNFCEGWSESNTKDSLNIELTLLQWLCNSIGTCIHGDKKSINLPQYKKK